MTAKPAMLGGTATPFCILVAKWLIRWISTRVRGYTLMACWRMAMFTSGGPGAVPRRHRWSILQAKSFTPMGSNRRKKCAFTKRRHRLEFPVCPVCDGILKHISNLSSPWQLADCGSHDDIHMVGGCNIDFRDIALDRWRGPRMAVNRLSSSTEV